MPLKASDAIDLGRAQTASDVVLQHVRNAIVDGTLDEGEPLRQDEVARLFNVSKVPVREALKRLEAEGLVEFRRHKGAVVTRLSEPDLEQVFEVRAILESSAIRMSIPHMTSATFDKALGYCDAFARETDVARWSELNWQFHGSLYEDAHRPYLVGVIRTVNDRLERYLRMQLTLSQGVEVADREHRQLVESCRRGRVDEAAELLRAHIMNAFGSLVRHLPTHVAKGERRHAGPERVTVRVDRAPEGHDPGAEATRA